MSILKLRSALAPLSVRRFATAAPSVSVTSTRSNASAPILGNIEASWKTLPAEEQYEVYQQLEQLQKKNWKELTIDEKKAAYFVAFGPHGPRTPANEPGHSLKVVVGVVALVGAAYGVFALARSQAAPPPRTMTTEYQEQMNEYMRSQNMNPISGVSSEGYKGKGMVQ
ncbi:cytochrome c oxidase subunit 4 [Cryptococcus neoformans]|nr:cytochrome c oxidase subunit 4 [Cryptococcus neoformans var. grubii c45]OWZ68794.1 hypothetical protein AYX15_00522 [Cryptococcus neoformans var. grubii]OXC58483.1 cytochrome c oxidase subunit 4 [Cryptococcus neoformans var. grubii MW-RSA852]OWZ72128.1 hypothetical protein AYX14_02465 [Cryptococcus neoformans var. grubii]OXB34320.1 cytochrome c oxidase subunit 4 [Cryptococcus neoformans var. grubii]